MEIKLAGRENEVFISDLTDGSTFYINGRNFMKVNPTHIKPLNNLNVSWSVELETGQLIYFYADRKVIKTTLHATGELCVCPF